MEQSPGPQRGAYRTHDTPTGVVAVVATLLWVLSGCVLAACDSATPATTGQVDSVSAGRICFTPEDADQTDRNGCRPISAGDAAGLQQGDCVTARIPSDEADRVTDVRKLDRACHIGAEPQVSTSIAIQNALLFAVVPAAVVIFGVVLPRVRRRRAAAREADRRANRTANSPTAIVELGEPTEVEVIDLSQPGRRSDH